MLRQGAAECANFFSICTKLQHLANAIINAGFVMIQSARVGVGRFAEGVRARDFPLPEYGALNSYKVTTQTLFQGTTELKTAQ